MGGVTANANERIRWLHKKIADGSYPNAVRLSERFGVSRRQATRDVEYMRRELSAPIEYDKSRRGFYYSADFALPATISVAQPDDYVECIAAMGDISAAGGARSIGDNSELTQMSIPYTAILEIPDKLTVIKLGRLISGRVPARRGDKKSRYICEFGSVEAFLGAIMALGAPVTIVSPEWLRQRLLENAESLIKANGDV